ncbi:MAG TPA: hypothetical protein PKU97_20395 [Kofleriaceae bacterium]|nr:hypothetical protein [Kofleriaceae bacterium]
MKRALVVLAILSLPALASAQPGYGNPQPAQPYPAQPYSQPYTPQPQPYGQPYGAQPGYYAQPPATTSGGFWDRGGGLVWGIGLGLGGMSSKDGPIECSSCSYSPMAVEVDAHLGGMMSPRLALLFEIQGNVQPVEEVGGGEGDKTLGQFAAMAAAQYWITPRLWLKGGIGVATLSYNYNDSSGTQEEPIDDGGVFLLGAGYEILAGRDFALDVQGRYVVGSYDGINDQISSGTIGLGVNWY